MHASCRETPATLDRPILRSVIIEENAVALPSTDKNAPPESLEPCEDFLLTKNDILEFFQIARSASEREYNHDLEWSRCRVRGTAILSDGKKAWWSIDRFRRGILWFADEKTAFYFFCGGCRSAKYYEACDVACIHGLE
jgi:hypothetical protein